MVKAFFLFFILTACASAQSNIYASISLIKGCPIALAGNKYFDKSEKFSYALINSDYDNNDALYFFSEKISPDSNNYFIVYVSNNVISGDNYLTPEKDSAGSIILKGEINMRHGSLIYVEVLYLKNENKIFYRFPSGIEHKNISTGVNLDFPMNLEIGIRDELIIMSTKIYSYQNSYGTSDLQFFPFPLINLHLSLGLRFLEHYKLDYRIGLMMIYEDFYGVDNGIFFQSDLFNTRLYATAGLDFITNGGEAHGVINYSESGGNYVFYCLGLGLRPGKHFSADLMYYIPNDKVFGYNYVYDINTGKSTRYNKVDEGIIKFAVQYSFIL